MLFSQMLNSYLVYLDTVGFSLILNNSLFTKKNWSFKWYLRILIISDDDSLPVVEFGIPGIGPFGGYGFGVGFAYGVGPFGGYGFGVD